MTEISPDADIMARTLYGEARGCGAAGMRHVASVILNRAAHPRWWGNDPVSVCVAPEQFSCWNKNDPNLPKLKKITTADPIFSVAVGIAEAAIAGTLTDETGGADSYYAVSMPHPPAWAPRAVKTFTDGWHQFCRVELPAERDMPDAAPVSVQAVNEPPAPLNPPPAGSTVVASDPDNSADVLMAAERAEMQG
jgi:hypothetical protein